MPNILFSVLSIVILWIVRAILLKIVWKNSEEANVRYRWQKVSSYIFLTLNIIIITQIWFKEFNSIITFLGLVSAGIAIALKDLLVNLFGWIFIISTKTFALGDRIQINKTIGDVIDIRAFQFTVMEIGNWVEADQPTGRIIHIPNGKVFMEHVANYSKAFQYIWNEIPVTITFDSDWKKAKEILLSITKQFGSQNVNIA